jgi:hypothetical protein
MAGYIVNTERIYPSVLIRDIVDQTERLPFLEQGQVCAMGWVEIGNPLFPIQMRDTHQKTKSLDPSRGGDVRNETIYHLKEFFRESEGRTLHLSRILGIDSKTKILKIKGKETKTIDTDEEIDIFLNGTMNEWDKEPIVEQLEILIKLCPSSKITVDIRNVKGEMEIRLSDEYGVVLYEVSGNADNTAKDELDGYSLYIGDKADCNYITIKTNVNHADYTEDFHITETFANGLIDNAGDEFVTTFHKENLSMVMQDCDYFISAGVENPTLIECANAVAENFSTYHIQDIITDDINDAITRKTNYGLSDEKTYWLWSRTPYKFLSGKFNIGLSGCLAGKLVKKNIRTQLERGGMVAEDRINGVAGVRYPIERNLSCGLKDLSREDKEKLTVARINTVEMRRTKIVFSDILSGYSRTSHLMSFPVSDGINYIDKTLARITEFNLFRNLAVGKTHVRQRARLFFELCEAMHYFDDDKGKGKGKAYDFTVTDINQDTVKIRWWGYMEGVIRKGDIQATIKARDNEL